MWNKTFKYGFSAIVAITAGVICGKATSDYREKGRRQKLDDEHQKLEAKIMQRGASGHCHLSSSSIRDITHDCLLAEGNKKKSKT